ncbi:hypothetical protein KCP75_02365 [Salmonella enterica subsp. enterica]|nr:hypothetical protein KCP75_02365 [Salmonella enterica subsp. enterica]
MRLVNLNLRVYHFATPAKDGGYDGIRTCDPIIMATLNQSTCSYLFALPYRRCGGALCVLSPASTSFSSKNVEQPVC